MLNKYLHRTGFRKQLTILVSAAILCLAVVSSMVSALEAGRRVRQQMVETGQRVTDNLARQSTLALVTQAPDNAREAVATALAFPDVVRVEIHSVSGEVLLSQAHAPGGGAPQAASVPGDAAAPSALARPAAGGEDGDAWVFESPVLAGNAQDSPFEMQPEKPRELGHVSVVISKASLNRLVTHLLATHLLIALSIAAVLLLLLGALTKRLTRPLNRLSDLMRLAQAGESGMRARPAGPPDITEMAKAFNRMMDVLEQREAELTRSRDEAVRVGLLKAQFAATVSHEVRTPLNGVVGMLDMLKTLPLSGRQREYVDEAWDAARSLTELINDILDFSRMDAGKLELESIDFSLRQLVEEAVAVVAQPARAKGLALGYAMRLGVPERVKGDPMRLRQVLLNLLGNAVKFTQQGEVALRVSARPAGGQGERQVRLHFEVGDTGIGMDGAALEHVFEAFTQADRSTTRKFGGTGLGLAICKQLVELMQGRIHADSQPGEGSTFRFDVLCGQADASAELHSGPGLQGQRVLVVDASGVVREFVESSVAADGGRCGAVASGAEALPALAAAAQEGDSYALVVMEAGATDGHGVELSSRIRSDARFSDVRLLLLLRHALGASGMAVGADAYLDKPLRLERLLEAVRRHAAPSGQRGGPAGLPAAGAPAVGPIQSGHRFDVLVAEDNRTNRAVAAGMLKILGCRCHLVSNGGEAVVAFRNQRFDLILMDCSMPEVDGYEATAHIRSLESPAGTRTPIIAMTANTQQGDAEKCLSAGMDDYLSKPVTLVALRQKIERWLSGAAPAAQAAKAPVPLAQDPAQAASFDFDKLENLRAVLGDSIDEAVSPFLEDTPQSLSRLASALQAGDAAAAQALCHSIKGSSGNLGAQALAELARQAHDLTQEPGRLGEIGALLPRLREAFDEAAAILLADAPRPAAGGEPAEKAPVVLVVDDDRSTRAALRYTLQRDGFHVEEAPDGAQALDMLDRVVPDVILLDAVMPVMDGFKACTRIKQREGNRNTPVLMITALEDNTSVERAFSVGASDYIPKPIHFAVLSQRVRGIIDASRAERHIRRLAYNDSLTGLPNRAMFLDRLGQQLELAARGEETVAVLFLDMDRFKYVNDTLGHDVGDRLLKAVADRIRRVVRGTDTVSRLGGDEFTVALAPADPAAAAAVAENISRTLTSSFNIDGHEIFMSTSIGISLYPQDGQDVGTLLKHADVAMYRAKKDNSGFQFFEASMEHSVSGQLRMETELRRALERQEFEVFYQPKARVGSGRVVGMEALVRWRHPARGLVPPIEFIPVAEQTGLITALGEWVLRTACAQAQRWSGRGGEALHVAVNISGRQLLQKGFVATVEKALRDTGLPPGMLELEITESTLMEYAKDTLELLRSLRDLGVRLSIDDFGTGYSSLAYLKRFPVNAIKIDRAFVRDIPGDADDMAIASVIISLAHSLRLEVVAEGVETEAQRQFMREHGCELMQGYLLSEPLPAAVFESRMPGWAAPALSPP